MRYSDPALIKMVTPEFEEACHEWDPKGTLQVIVLCHAGGTQWCGDALEMIRHVAGRTIARIMLSAPAMSF